MQNFNGGKQYFEVCSIRSIHNILDGLQIEQLFRKSLQVSSCQRCLFLIHAQTAGYFSRIYLKNVNLFKMIYNK